MSNARREKDRYNKNKVFIKQYLRFPSHRIRGSRVKKIMSKTCLSLQPSKHLSPPFLESVGKSIMTRPLDPTVGRSPKQGGKVRRSLVSGGKVREVTCKITRQGRLKCRGNEGIADLYRPDRPRRTFLCRVKSEGKLRVMAPSSLAFFLLFLEIDFCVLIWAKGAPRGEVKGRRGVTEQEVFLC